MWDATVPKILSYLNNNLISDPSKAKNEVEINKWEGLIRRLITETIKLVNDDMWVMLLSDAIIQQFPLYEGDIQAKKVALKVLGLILGQISHKDYIKRTLETLFASTNHGNEEERVGCAQGYGFCGSSHLDIVLENLAAMIKGSKPSESRSSSSSSSSDASGGDEGLFGSIFGGSSKPSSSSKGPVGVVGDKTNTIILAYGYVTTYAKPHYITSRLEIHVINNMNPFFESRDTKFQQTIIQSIELIAQTANPEHLQQPYTFKHRDAFIGHLLSYLRLTGPKQQQQQSPASNNQKKDANNTTTSSSSSSSSSPSHICLDNIPLSVQKYKVAVLALNACSTLVSLDPNLPPNVEDEILQVVSQYYSIQKELDVDEKPDNNNTELLFQNLDKLLLTIMSKESNISCMKRITGSSLSIFFSSNDTTHRLRSISSFVKLLKKYVDVCSTKKPSDKNVDEIGNWIAKMLPRTCDPNGEIRGLSIESIQLLLYIQWLLSRFSEEPPNKAISEIDIKPPKSLSPFTGLRKKMQQSDDQNEQFSLVHSMASILAKVLSANEIPKLVISSLPGLVDSQIAGARGTCVIIYGIISTRGSDLSGQVIPIVRGLIEKMQYIANDQTLNGTLHALKSICKIHLQDTMDAILSLEIPHKTHVTKVMQLLTRDKELVVPVIKYLTDLLNNGDIMEDTDYAPRGGPNKAGRLFDQVPTIESQAATICLSEMLKEEDAEEVINENFPLIFGTLSLRVGTTQGHHDSSSNNVECWKNFFTLLQEEEVIQKLDETGIFQLLPDPMRYIDGVTTITATVSKRHVAEMRGIVKFLQSYLKANYNGQRLVAAFSLAEMVNHSSGDPELLDQLLTLLLNSLVDPILKIPALRGMGNIVSAPPELTNKYAPTVLDALMSLIDHKDDEIALESMNGLAKVFKVVDETRIAPILINICHRIRPAFDNPNPRIRASSAALFAALSRFGDGVCKDSLYEQVHSNLPSIILHINDDDPEVQRSFKSCLKDVGPLLRDQSLNKMLTTNHIFRVDGEMDYSDFLNMHLSKALIATWPDRLNSYVQICINPYFTSDWDIIKANAAYFIGSLMGHIPLEIRKDVGINSGHTAKALIALLSEKSPIVRQKTAEAISMMHSY
eukprot:TRINITY_DN2562_c0_g2_i2.p1 TRINITY_DN2562_c0_g2~~TRINITY_DN2562_c0_g2_i2.p1  ORF type:complete len:1126 (-),score=250.20 TRINITY_DN2562_c0_g2_i2:7-3384(-)